MTLVMVSMFFFSSRRRHTRSLCDWSSDVCSSDLGRATGDQRAATITNNVFNVGGSGSTPATWDVRAGTRSEERRVGKECRSPGAPDPQKNDDEHISRKCWRDIRIPSV